MARNITQRLRASNNLWWVTAGGVLLFAFCAGGAVLVRSFYAASSTALPSVPPFVYNSPVPVSPFPTSSAQFTTPGVLTPQLITPVSTITSLPFQAAFSTPTNSSIWSWIFPGSSSSQGISSTAIPIKTSTPLQAIVITLTPTKTPLTPLPPPPPAQNPPSATVCNNILYPARPGNQWVYYVNTPKRIGDAGMRVVSVEGSQAIIDVTDPADGSVSRAFMQCDQDIILNFPLLSVQSMISDSIDGAVNVDYVAGVLAPNEAAFISSNWALSWASQYRIYGTGTIVFNGRIFSVSVSPSIVNMTCQTVAPGDAAFENITVYAGAFRALKVICRGEGTVAAVVNGSPVTGIVSAQATEWFAPRIGLLKSQSDFVNLNVFGITIPFSSGGVTGSIELRNYFVGP